MDFGKKPENARELLNFVEDAATAWGMRPPYYHVSDPIANDEELAAGFRGDKFVYIRLGGHPDHLRIENWFNEFYGTSRSRAVSDGMAAISRVILALYSLNGLPKTTRHFILVRPAYGGTDEFMTLTLPWLLFGGKFRVDYVCADSKILKDLLNYRICDETVAVIFEMSGNPTLTVPDVSELTEVCKNPSFTKSKPAIVCDSTFLALFKPIKWGVDIQIVSGTKYMEGESGWSLGIWGTSAEFEKEHPEFWERTDIIMRGLGGVAGVTDSWITGSFSLVDFEERWIEHSVRAREVAEFLEGQPAVEKVIYPGLPSHPQYANALKYVESINGRQYFGGMVSFYLKADKMKAREFVYRLNRTEVIKNQASLAHPDNIVSLASDLSHHFMNPFERQECGITDNLVRLSVGRIRTAGTAIDVLAQVMQEMF